MLEAQGLLFSGPRRGVKVAPLDPLAALEVTTMCAVPEGKEMDMANLLACHVESHLKRFEAATSRSL